MRLILNGINGRYLREIPDNAVNDTELVEAAVAYATNDTLLFDWCWDNQIPLRFWGRFDETVPVKLDILRSFLGRRSPNFVCKLVTHFHAKVIWWHGVGAYIGSANLTDAAWYRNIEAGCYFDETEMVASGIDIQLRSFFQRVDEYASPLTDELFAAIESRLRELQRSDEQDREQRKRFLATTSVRHWPGLVHVPAGAARDRQKRAFLDEWFATLQILRDIAATVSKDESRPDWLPSHVPPGAQADQFLHAYYYNRVIGEGRRSLFAEKFEENRLNPARALSEAMTWWRALPEPPSNEDRMLFEWAPFLREALSQDRILNLTGSDFESVCHRVWSIQDHALRVSNATLNLPGGRKYDRATKTKALAEFLFSRRSQNGSTVLQVLNHVLYGGTDETLPIRLWETTADDAWRIEHLGISALGELVGWALPDKFPPRNNRTSKALYSLGFPVTFHGS
ncbi:MAG: phospholipase [Xanthobacteraceae bacterium]